MTLDVSGINTLADIVRTYGRDRGEQLAIVQDDHRETWAELRDRSARAANALADAGVGSGDRIAFIDKNGYEYFELLFGASMLNAVLVNVNWRLAPPEVAWIVNDSEAEVFVFGSEFADTVDAIRGDIDRVTTLVCLGDDERFDGYESWLSDDTTDPNAPSGPGDIAFQLYSSGTTGLPKGVMLSNDNLFTLTPAAASLWGFTGEMTNLAAMPLFHIGGSGWAVAGMVYGATTVLVRDIDPSALIDLIGEHGITHAFLVPAVLQFMLMMPNIGDGDFSSLELIAYGASPITDEVLVGSLTAFGCDFVQVYGLTETTGAIFTLPNSEHDPDGPNAHRLRSCGVAHPGVEVRIVDEDTFADVAAGEVGEIVVRTAQNMVGYWRNEEGTREAFIDDWFRTGDAGYLDDDGYLYIHDRVKDMVVSGGENVYPAEVENALMKHPGIADVAVIGVPDDKWGEAVKAITVKAEGHDPTEADIIGFARERLAGFKVPKTVDFVDAIPRNPTGKVIKKDLRAPFWVGRDRQVN